MCVYVLSSVCYYCRIWSLSLRLASNQRDFCCPPPFQSFISSSVSLQYCILEGPPLISQSDWFPWPKCVDAHGKGGCRNFGWGCWSWEQWMYNCNTICNITYKYAPNLCLQHYCPNFTINCFTILLALFEWLCLISQTTRHNFPGQPLGWRGVKTP